MKEWDLKDQRILILYKETFLFLDSGSYLIKLHNAKIIHHLFTICLHGVVQ